MSNEGIVKQLASTALFSGLDNETLTDIADRSIRRNYARGQIIFNQGDEGSSLYVLLQGLLKVVVSDGTGGEMLLTTLTPPATFGELALIDGRPRSASVLVGEPAAVVLVVNRSVWDELLENHPALKDGLIFNLTATLRRLTDQTADFVFLDLAGRIAKLLMRAYENSGDPALDMHLTQTDIAHRVGGSRQSVNQIFGHLAARGYIELQGRTIVIRDAGALKRRAGL